MPISSTVRVGIAIYSYGEELTFGITGDYDTAADLDVLSQAIENDLARLVQAAAPARSVPAPSSAAGVVHTASPRTSASRHAG